jgi:UPF0176 protein
MEKVILYYKFVPVKDPEVTRLWQRELCERYGLRGRIIISKQGINGTLGGPVDGLKAYVKAMKSSLFKNTAFKWSDGGADDFPKLSIKVRPELVAFGAPDAIKVNQNGVVGGGKHLKPEEVNKLVESRGDEVVFFDGRNEFEAKIGKFKNTVVPSVRYTREFLKELDDPKYDSIKDKPVVSYCTGGIRCELLSVHMKNAGFKEVYQIDGGIVKYGEKYGDDGLWEGKLYVFDNRMVTSFSDKAKDIGECVHCGAKTSNYENCSNKLCNDLILICKKCHKTTTVCTNPECARTVNVPITKH